ncbi:hypothetical protein [Lentibacillus sp. Marseille-P4043]|uniref:hypothetical protein n=1 Tax=Lentibacillus sp. Marseille-P4043 TaxID=2040293 RepID=UPI000D0BC701|nr:hypothetical protein [Lentibacillus sp. Marseille-P4043]
MKKIYLIIPLLFILIGCRQEITEQDLIGGNWIGTAGYEDGEAKGEPNCYPFQDGIKFKDGNTVYVETRGRDFEYYLSENEEGKITFRDSGPDESSNDMGAVLFHYQLKIINEDGLVLKGRGLREGQSCYLERN